MDMEKYHIKVVRVAGGLLEWLPFATEEFTVEARDKQEAFIKSQLLSTLKFRGQERRTYVNGELYLDLHY